MVRKALLAAVLVAAGTTMSVTAATAAPAGSNGCGFDQHSDGHAWYWNCSDLGARIRVLYDSGIATYCIAPHTIKYLGWWEVNDAYTYASC